MGQAELFKDDSNAWQTGTRTSFFSTKQWTLGLDKIILLMIVTMIFFVLSYSFGYERGRRSLDEKMRELTKQIETTPVASETQGRPQSQQNSTQEENTTTSDTNANTEPSNSSSATTSAADRVIEAQNGKYTVQLATVLQRDRAEQQLKVLEKKGLKAFLLVRGKYYEICVGSFGTVSSAKSLLSRVRSEGSYSDAFIRPISHG